MALITLQQAKDHLRITNEASDSDIDLKLQQAEAIVLDRCNSTAAIRTESATWTALTVPLAIQAAILVMLTHLHEHRGDDMVTEAATYAAVDRMIGTHRPPVLA